MFHSLQLLCFPAGALRLHTHNLWDLDGKIVGDNITDAALGNLARAPLPLTSSPSLAPFVPRRPIDAQSAVIAERSRNRWRQHTSGRKKCRKKTVLAGEIFFSMFAHTRTHTGAQAQKGWGRCSQQAVSVSGRMENP